MPRSGSALVSSVGFGVSPKQSCAKSVIAPGAYQTPLSGFNISHAFSAGSTSMD